MKWGIGLVEICVRRLPEDGTPVPKHVTAILSMNYVLWFVFYSVNLLVNTLNI